MGWDGNGNFNRTDGTRTGTKVWQDARDAGIKIRADDHDTHDEDIADGVENTVALDGQNTTTTDNAILRYDVGNSKFEGVTISASQVVGRSASGDTRGMSAATARSTMGLASASPANNTLLKFSSSSNKYVEVDFLDEDDMASNSDTAVPTQQSVKAYALTGPGTSSSPSLAFDTWRTPNANRLTWVTIRATTQTDGTTDGQIFILVDESGGTSFDYSLGGIRADPGLGNGGENQGSIVAFIPAGASYQIQNQSDPNNNNNLSEHRELTL